MQSSLWIMFMPSSEKCSSLGLGIFTTFIRHEDSIITRIKKQNSILCYLKRPLFWCAIRKFAMEAASVLRVHGLQNLWKFYIAGFLKRQTASTNLVFYDQVNWKLVKDWRPVDSHSVIISFENVSKMFAYILNNAKSNDFVILTKMDFFDVYAYY
jgi:hypothetical protein